MVEEEEEEKEEEEEGEVESDEDSEVSEKEVRGPKGSVIKVVANKPRVASTVWTRLNHTSVKSEVKAVNNRYVDTSFNFKIRIRSFFNVSISKSVNLKLCNR